MNFHVFRKEDQDLVIRLTAETSLVTLKRVVLGNCGGIRLTGECSREYGRRGIGKIKSILLFLRRFVVKRNRESFSKCLYKPENSITERKPKSLLSPTL